MEKDPGAGVGIRYGGGGATAYGGGYATAPKDRKPGRVPFWKHPYFRVALVLVVLLVLIVVFILLGGCLQTGEKSGTVTASHTPGSSLAATVATATPVLPATTPVIPVTTVSPPLTPTSSPPITQPVPEEAAAAATATPPFLIVPGKLSDDPYPISTSSLAGRIHELINDNRAANGLAPLAVDPALDGLALNHSTDMAANNYFSHTDLSGEDPTARGNASGYTCIKVLRLLLHLRDRGKHLPEQPLHFGDRHKRRLFLRVEHTGRDCAVHRHRLDEQRRTPEKYPHIHL